MNLGSERVVPLGALFVFMFFENGVPAALKTLIRISLGGGPTKGAWMTALFDSSHRFEYRFG
jgi:hypothetical protein